MQTHIVAYQHKISAELRARQKHQKSCLIWFTGFSGSGKSTLANALDQELYRRGHHTYILDGDNVRLGLNQDLGFAEQDRVENIRRIGEVSKLFVDAGLIVLSAFISPFASDRRMVRDLFAPGEFIEVHVSTPLDVCERRDPKGLYRKARQGEIKNFTGIDSSYEPPRQPEIEIDTAKLPLEQSLDRMVGYLIDNGLIHERAEGSAAQLEPQIPRRKQA